MRARLRSLLVLLPLLALVLGACGSYTPPMNVRQFDHLELATDPEGIRNGLLVVIAHAVDVDGRFVDKIPVRFRVLAGGGTISATVVDSDVRGQARVTWTLGSVSGSVHTIEARADGAEPVTLTITVP